MFVKPARGKKVRDPFKKTLLPENGAVVSDTDPFWRRRLRDGDVVKASKPVKATAKKREVDNGIVQ
ncbi:DUF2635 domain-containing protein [Salmonella enterica subsp. enterica serovar Alachua]|nr:DUF2635 domain-containing protein [Salmonella enterica subsp. enterica serovar Alachua]